MAVTTASKGSKAMCVPRVSVGVRSACRSSLVTLRAGTGAACRRASCTLACVHALCTYMPRRGIAQVLQLIIPPDGYPFNANWLGHFMSHAARRVGRGCAAARPQVHRWQADVVPALSLPLRVRQRTATPPKRAQRLPPESRACRSRTHRNPQAQAAVASQRARHLHGRHRRPAGQAAPLHALRPRRRRRSSRD